MAKEFFGLVLLLAASAGFAQERSAQIPQPLPPGPRQPPRLSVVDEPLPAPKQISESTGSTAITPPAQPKPNLPLKTPSPGIDPEELQRRLTRLRIERERLNAERGSIAQALTENEPNPEKMAELQLRLGELLGRLGAQHGSAKGRAVPPPASPLPPEPSGQLSQRGKVSPAGESLTSPVDPLALGRTLFRTRDFAGALKAFRQVNLNGMPPEERRPIEYLMATCLKHLGKLEEAAAIYREVAGSKGDEVLANCAQWQLSTLRWQQEFDQQVRQPQQRLQELENQP